MSARTALDTYQRQVLGMSAYTAAIALVMIWKALTC